MMCLPQNSKIYKSKYRGAFYNWYSINAETNGNKNVCPMGWHVPTDEEWITLVLFLGGESVAGGKMKTIGVDYWLSPNTSALNQSGFSGLPGGLRNGNGAIYNIGVTGNWWSSTLLEPGSAWVNYMYYQDGNTSNGTTSSQAGFSVRCLKD
jgi:uncharacterized protein (TIGR02145 family)